MSDPTDPRSWVEYAEEDYVVATSSFRRRVPLTNTTCFHAQQCAEKYLKAVLVAQGRTFPKTHDLLELSARCADAGVFVPVSEKELSVLTDHAIHTRYPGEAPVPEEAREALATARDVRRFVRKLLSVR